MTTKKAYNIFVKQFPKLEVLSCYEYDSRFVFQAVSKKYANTKDANKILDSLYSVDKKTGEMSLFKPFDIPADEYNRGKKRALFPD